MHHSRKTIPGIALIALAALTSASALANEPSPAWDGELFLELRRGRFHLRPYAGLAWRVRDSGCTYLDEQVHTTQPCSEIDPSKVAMLDDWRRIFYTGVAIGLSL